MANRIFGDNITCKILVFGQIKKNQNKLSKLGAFFPDLKSQIVPKKHL
jgi:hypothetical protein